MEARIKVELKGRAPSKIGNLFLDFCEAPAISGLTEEFTSLETLSLMGNGLTSLEGLPRLETLKTIDLSENKLTGGFDLLVNQCPGLISINLINNPIKNSDALLPLKELKNLKSLDLADCEVAEGPDNRKAIFELIPNLRYMDGFDVNNEEVESSGDEEDDDEGSCEDEEQMDFDGEDVSYEEDEEDENGLALLDSSKALQDDHSEDFVVDKTESDIRGKKRKREAGDGCENDEPDAKMSQ